MTRRPLWVVTDLVSVMVLIGLAEMALVGTFEGWGHLVVAEIAAAIGLLVVLLTARLPMAVLVAAVPIVALVFGGPVALRSSGLGAGVPDLQTLADVMQGTWTGPGELLTTLPWVDLAGSPAMVPFLFGYVGAVLAGAVALRSRSAAGPVIPLLAVLAASLLLRRPEGPTQSPAATLLGWYPVAFAVVAIAWSVVRSLRVAPGASVRGAAHGRFTRGVVATLVVAGALLVAVPLTVPFSDGAPTSAGKLLRGRSAALEDLSGLDSPLRRFRTFTDQGAGSVGNVHDKVLFTVTGAPAGSRVRMLAYDRYDGHEWLPGNNTMPGTTDDAFQRLDTRVDSPVQGQPVRSRVIVTRAYASDWMPTVGSLQSLRMVFADPRGQRGEMRYNLATSTAVLPTGVGRRDPYEFTAVIPPVDVDATMLGWTGKGLTSIQGLDRLDEFQPQVLEAVMSPIQKVFLLAATLREQGRYSDGAAPGEQQYEAGHDLDRLVDDFLLARRPVGNDEQYAAAMALLANRVGVPARVVVGAVLPRDGKVRGEDVHAWVELRVADGSWRTLATREFMSRTPPRAVMPPPPPLQLPPSTNPPRDKADQPTAADRKDATGPTSHDRVSGLVRTVPLVLLLVLALVVPTVKAVRRRRRRHAGRSADRMAGAWTELVDQARDLGVPVRVHASRPAQARVLALSGAAQLSEEADDGVFAAEEPSEAAVSAYWDQVMAERRELRAGRGLWRRLWAPFNPVTLVGGRVESVRRRRARRPLD